MRHLTYLALLAGCLLVTVPLDRVYRARVFSRPRQLLLAIVPGVVLFGGWDVYAIRRGHWTYDLSRMSGVLLPGRLPLEEALFFLVVPLAAILTYECVRVTHARRARGEPAASLALGEPVASPTPGEPAVPADDRTVPADDRPRR